MPCMCGATDCPSCGPDQGYVVVRAWSPQDGWHYRNPEDDEDDERTCADGCNGCDECTDDEDEPLALENEDSRDD